MIQKHFRKNRRSLIQRLCSALSRSCLTPSCCVLVQIETLNEHLLFNLLQCILGNTQRGLRTHTHTNSSCYNSSSSISMVILNILIRTKSVYLYVNNFLFQPVGKTGGACVLGGSSIIHKAEQRDRQGERQTDRERVVVCQKVK